MDPMSERDLEQDVNELKERTALLDGWRQGESERYERLERDIVRNRDELGARMDRVREELGARIDRTREELGGRIDRTREELGMRIGRIEEEVGTRIGRVEEELVHQGARIDRLFWMMLVTLGGLASNLAVVILRT